VVSMLTFETFRLSPLVLIGAMNVEREKKL
jgi:hypothetical protein